MAKTGSILSGVPHVAVKSASVSRPNMLSVRVSPIKRMVAAAPKIKEDKPSNVGKF